MTNTVTFRILLLVGTLLLAARDASAQKGAFPGYIITLQNDTLPGKVVDRGDFANSSSIRFVDNRTGEAREYKPGEIKGYGFGPDHAYVTQDLTASFVAQVLFARQVVKGYASLYSTVPKAGSPVYIVQKEDGGLLPLEQKTYFGLLKYTFSDCAALHFDRNARKVSNYSRKSLQQLVGRYNACISPQEAQKSYQRKLKPNYGIIAGAALNHYLYLFDRNERNPASGDYGWKSTLLPGLFVGIPLGRKMELEWQVLYGQYQGSHTRYYTNGVYGEQPFRFKFTYLNTPLLIRYHFWDRIYLNAGPNLNFRLSQSGTQRFMGSTEPFEGYPSRVSLGVVAGAGFKVRLLNRVSLVEGRLYSNRIQDGVNQIASFNSYQVLLRINLNK
jgi:hypothetical protein